MVAPELWAATVFSTAGGRSERLIFFSAAKTERTKNKLVAAASPTACKMRISFSFNGYLGLTADVSRATLSPLSPLLPTPDPNLHQGILREHHFVSPSNEVRIHRHPGAVCPHRVAESSRLHG